MVGDSAYLELEGVNDPAACQSQVMQAAFGSTFAGLVQSGSVNVLLAANPKDACSGFVRPSLFQNAVVFVQRGNCTFSTKVILFIVFS